MKGISAPHQYVRTTQPMHKFYMDVSSSCGFSSFFQEEWSADGPIWTMSFLEPFFLIVTFKLWGEKLQKRHIIDRMDNMSIVQVINNPKFPITFVSKSFSRCLYSYC